jgi:multidrug efflux pump subunit AcrA (membrane-fusion protein)
MLAPLWSTALKRLLGPCILAAVAVAAVAFVAAQEKGVPSPAKAEAPVTPEALDARLQRLEQRVDALLQRRDAGASPGIDPARIRRIRPRFECLVVKLSVKVGQEVHKGDPLAELDSSKLVSAKNDLLVKTMQWTCDKRLLDLRRKLVATGALSNQLWVDTQNDEEKSRLELDSARDHLRFLGLSPSEIDAVAKEEGPQKALFTLRAPVDGRVIETRLDPGDVADPGTILMALLTPQP